MRASVDRWFSRPSRRLVTPGPSSRRRKPAGARRGRDNARAWIRYRGLDVAEILKKESIKPCRWRGRSVRIGHEIQFPNRFVDQFLQFCTDSFSLLQQTRTSSSENPYSFIALQNSARATSPASQASKHDCSWAEVARHTSRHPVTARGSVRV